MKNVNYFILLSHKQIQRKFVKFKSHHISFNQTAAINSMELKDAVFSLDYDDGEDFTVTLDDGVALRGCIWKPSSAPRFTYVFVHGLAACATFKKDFFPLILSRGGVVYACDHYGHGRSPGPRISGTVDRLVDETVRVIQRARSDHPTLPVVLHGHSMGGLCAICTILTRYESDLRGAVSCVIAEAPWISPCPQRSLNAFEWYSFKLLSWVTPHVHFSTGVELYSAGMDQRFVDLCHARTDVMGGSEITPQLYMSVDERQGFVHAHPELWPAELPLLFLQGKADNLVDASRSDQWVRAVLAREGVRVTYRLYEDGEHVMLKTALRPAVAKEILDFVDANTQ